MKSSRILIFLLTSCMFVACNKQEHVETFSEEKPYSLEIKKERSYFQAEKIVNRLSKMGLDAYVLSETTEDGIWYRIVSGALKDSSEVAQYTNMIDSTFHLKPSNVLNYAQLDSATRTPIKQVTVDERHRIDANQPAVPAEIKDVIQKFPENNIFYLQKIGMLTFSEQAIQASKGKTLDLPRGISLRYLAKNGCKAIAAVIYEDNLYGDQVTLHVVRYKDRIHMQVASLIPTRTEYNEVSLALCSDIADMILETGNYNNERKDIFEADAYTHLSGYKVSFDSKEKHRVYYIFTDESGDYIYMAQSTKDDDKEVVDFLCGIGKGEGLEDFDEFYNTYYTMPDNPAQDDVFIGYYVDRLTWGYAKNRGYATWAKRMVGHWEATTYFYNPSKGIWSCSLFDLLTESAEANIYGTLYRNNLNTDDKRSIYGTEGAAIYHYNWWTYENYLSEINFGFDRYVVALSGNSSYTERDLIHRAELLQFIRGGYREEKKTEE